MYFQSFGSRLLFNASDAMAMDEVLLRVGLARHVTEETDSNYSEIVCLIDGCFHG